MNIEDLTIKQAKELAGLLTTSQSPHPYELGANYFIRLVTHHYTGRLVPVTEHELVLEDCAWIADDGRFAQAVEKGTFNEVEPFPTGAVILGRGAILDATKVVFSLPRSQK